MSEPRTVDEVKNDIRKRVGQRAPFLQADKAESEQALARMANFEGETWAAAWNELGAKWEDQAKAAEQAGNVTAAKAAFLKSYGYYGIARHPFPSTPGKHHGYRKTREMFLAASKYFDIPVERVAIPFQNKADKAIIGHLRLPKQLPAPMIMHWAASTTGKKNATPSVKSSSRKAGAVSLSIAQAPVNVPCSLDRMPIKSTWLCSNTCANGLRSTPTRSPSSAPASAAIGRPSSPTWRRTNCAARSTGAAAFIISFSPSGKNARAMPTPICSI